MGKVVFHFALVQFACYCIYVFCFATCKRYHININALIEWTSTKSNLFFSFLLSCTFSLKLLLLAYLCLTVKSRQKLERQKHSRLSLKPKKIKFSPPLIDNCNRRVQVTSCLPLGPCRSQSDQTDGCSLSKPWCRQVSSTSPIPLSLFISLVSLVEKNRHGKFQSYFWGWQ